MKFSFFKSVRARGVLCTPELLKRETESKALADTAARIARTKDDKRRGELKRLLPIVTWQAFSTTGRRRNNDMEPSGLFMLDIDHMEENPRKFFTEKIKSRTAELGIRVVHKTPSCKGLRIVADCRYTEIADNQRWLAGELGLREFDEVCKDIARSSFLVPRKYFYYVDKALFTAERPANLANPTQKQQYEVKQSESTTTDEKSAEPTDTLYDGIEYGAIVEALAEQLGGVPSHGSRNTFLFSMACHLRYVCNNDPAWIERVLPNYGENQERLRSTIRSACNRAQAPYMPSVVKRAIEVARRRTAEDDGQKGSDFGMFGSEPPRMPEKLPPLIELLTSRVPDLYKPAVAMSVFPALGCHLHGVTFRYIDNVEHEPAFMTLQIARQSMGKGAVNKPIDYIMADIVERDEENRRRETAWKESTKKKGANKEKPARPNDICVQWLSSNVTQAAFVMRLADAERNGRRPLYIRLDEVEGLTGLCGRGFQANTELIRIVYDRGKWGQERVGVESVTERPDCRLNFNASATPVSARSFFQRRAMTDGTLTRMTLCTIVRPDGERTFPKFGEYSDEFGAELKPYIDRLNSASGLIECDRVAKLADQLREENEDIIVLSGDEVFEVMSFRANRSAFDRAMLLYIAHEGWSDEMDDFVRWSEQYDLWCKMRYFGAEMEEAMSETAVRNKRGPKNMLGNLPERFTKVDIARLGLNIKFALYNWKRRGFIAQDEATGEYYKLKMRN